MRDGGLRHLAGGSRPAGFGQALHDRRRVFGLFVAGYTGVLLASQPAHLERHVGPGRALPGLRAQRRRRHDRAVGPLWRRDARAAEAKLSLADRYFILLELVLLAIFFMTLGRWPRRCCTGAGSLLWALVLVGILIPLVVHRTSGMMPVLAALLVLIGSFALRTAIVLSPQL